MKVWVIVHIYKVYWEKGLRTRFYGDSRCNSVTIYDNPKFFKTKHEAEKILKRDSELGYHYLDGYEVKEMRIESDFPIKK